MGKQISYIIKAFLGLFTIGIIILFFQTLPLTGNKNAFPKQPTDYFPVSQKTEFSESALKGKALFMSKCASCHAIFKGMTGPSLAGLTQREPWTNRQNVYDWVRNPPAFIERNEYARNLKELFGGTMMTAFPGLTDEEIDAICNYLNEAEKVKYQSAIAQNN